MSPADTSSESESIAADLDSDFISDRDHWHSDSELTSNTSTTRIIMYDISQRYFSKVSKFDVSMSTSEIMGASQFTSTFWSLNMIVLTSLRLAVPVAPPAICHIHYLYSFFNV